MNEWLTILAIVAQLSDAALTCRTLSQGGVERNPVLGKRPSCGKVVGIKGAALFLIPVAPKGRWRTTMQLSNIASGSIGVPLPLMWR